MQDPNIQEGRARASSSAGICGCEDLLAMRLVFMGGAGEFYGRKLE
jgi:hypothetical protein